MVLQSLIMPPNLLRHAPALGSVGGNFSVDLHGQSLGEVFHVDRTIHFSC